MKETYDLIKHSHLVAPTLHWMLNSYAKHTDLTQEDIDLYFKQKGEEENATS